MRRAALLRDLVFRPLLQFKGRALLSVAAIALGVALGYAVQLINAIAIGEFAHAVQALSGEADLVVLGPRAGFDESLYPRIAAMSEVAVASPMLDIEAKIGGRRELLRVIAVDIFRAALVQPELVASEGGERLDFLRPDRIFLSASAAEWLELKAGDALRVQVGLDEVSLRVAGILEAGSIRQRLGVVDIAGAQASLKRPGVINRIDIRLRAGVELGAFAERLRRELPPGLEVEAPQAELERSASLSRAYRVNLNVLALVALFTGGLLVFSTQALAVMRRRAQIALLRVLGFTRSQVLALLLGEALSVGVLGALAGILLGHLIAQAVLQVFGADLGAGHFRGLKPQIRFEPVGIAVFGLLGVARPLPQALFRRWKPPARTLRRRSGRGTSSRYSRACGRRGRVCWCSRRAPPSRKPRRCWVCPSSATSRSRCCWSAPSCSCREWRSRRFRRCRCRVSLRRGLRWGSCAARPGSRW